jgi:ABC-2 type transport system permease protein
MLRRHEAHIQRELQVKLEGLRRDTSLELAKIERTREQQVQQAQNHYKVLAVVPTIFPMFVGLIVWAYRRVREREGVSRSRMRG